ncbi:hypothetical protein Cus16_2874 [Curtobacterium sp. ER1/6]|nr:hypothetical protein Cus16_2874 [Curtobacterium sp. ER1/6]
MVNVDDEVVVFAWFQFGAPGLTAIRPPRVPIYDRPLDRTDPIVRIDGDHPGPVNTQSGRVDRLNRLDSDRFVAARVYPNANSHIRISADRNTYLQLVVGVVQC